MAMESLFNAEENGWSKNRIDDTTVAYEQDDGEWSIVISKEQGEYKISPYASKNGAIEDAVYESTIDDAQGVIANWIFDHPYK